MIVTHAGGTEQTAPAKPEAEGFTGKKSPPPVVLVDPGHGGLDGGTVGNGLIEKDWTLKVGLALAKELRRRGHAVAMTRESDVTLGLLDRPALANRAPPRAMLSVHFNAGSPDATGVETWYSWPKKPQIMARLHDSAGRLKGGVDADDDQRLATAVQEALQGRTGARDRGIRNRPDLAVTSWSLCPAILIECGFLSNTTESRQIQESAYLNQLVTGIADGYEKWLETRRAVPPDTPLLEPIAVPVPENADDAAH